jgi:hypothetical protein
MYRLEIKISVPGEANSQVIWKDVESKEEGEEHGKWVQKEYAGTNKQVDYCILQNRVKYRFRVYLYRPRGNNEWEVGSDWFDDMQDAANYGWMKMRELNAEGYVKLHGSIVDNTDHIRANLLGRDTTAPIPHVDSRELNLLTEALDRVFQEKLSRDTKAWKENGRSILDVIIKTPRSVFKAQLGRDMRVVDVKGDGQFLINSSDDSFRDLFDALERAGRHVNRPLKTTISQ